jgi:hypothetical protein
MTLPAHAPLIVKVRLKYNMSVNMGTLLFRPKEFSSISRLALQWGEWNMGYDTRTNVLRAVQFRLKLVSHEGHFTV